MNTGQQSLYRGYSFSASDAPTARPRGMVRRLKRLLRPRRHHESEQDMPYMRARDSAMAVPLSSGPDTEVETEELKRESFVDESVIPDQTHDSDHSRYETAAAAPVTSLPERTQDTRIEPPLFMPNSSSHPTVSDAFFTALDHQNNVSSNSGRAL